MSVRITGIELQDGWKVGFALTRIKGIGWSLSDTILDSVKVDKSKRVSELTTSEVSKITARVEDYPTEGDLARRVRENVTRLKQTGSYRGVRHTRALPSRGQRTRRNARTKRGKRKTVGAFKKEALTKMTSAKEKE